MNNQPVNIGALLVRALKTFLQASLAFLTVGVIGATSVPTTKALIGGAIAAGFSAVMNLFLQPQEAK